MPQVAGLDFSCARKGAWSIVGAYFEKVGGGFDQPPLLEIDNFAGSPRLLVLAYKFGHRRSGVHINIALSWQILWGNRMSESSER